MKILIVDDEPLALRRLQMMLEDIASVQIITTTNGQKAVDEVASHHPHIVFLDIQMPVLSGIDAAKQIRQISPETKIIFCTAFDEFALQAFDLSASDYLLKPVTKQRLLQALDKVGFNDKPSAFSFQQGTDLLSLDSDDIYCFISEDKTTTMHCQLGEVIIDESLLALEQRFLHKFVRINRNALVNINELYGIHREQSYAFARLKSTEYQPKISRRNLTLVKDIIKS